MTTKFMAINSLSIRGENDTERILLKNLNDLMIGGKQPVVQVVDGDLIISVVAKESK